MKKKRFKFENIFKIIFLLSVILVLFCNQDVKALTFDQFKGNAAYACLQHGGTFRRQMSVGFIFNATKTKYKVTASGKRIPDGTKPTTVVRHYTVPVENSYAPGKTGTITTAPCAPADERKVARVLYNHTGWRGATQCWIWGNIGTVKSVLSRGGHSCSGCQNVVKAAKISFIEKMAIDNNVLNDDDFDFEEESVSKISPFVSNLGEGDVVDPVDPDPVDPDPVVGSEEVITDVEETEPFNVSQSEEGYEEKLTKNDDTRDVTDEDTIYDSGTNETLDDDNENAGTDAADEVTKNSASGEGEIFNDDDKKQSLEEQTNSETKTNKDLDDYIEETGTIDEETTDIEDSTDKVTDPENKKFPTLQNKGEKLVFSYNDIAGPYVINWDTTNRDRNFSAVKKSKGKPEAVSRLVKLTIHYLDGSTETLDNENSKDNSKIRIIQEGVNNGKPFKELYKIECNVPFYVVNPNLDREVTGIDVKIKKRIKIYVVKYRVLKAGRIKPQDTKYKGAIGWETIQKKPQELVQISRSIKIVDYTNEIHIETYVKKGSIELTKKGIYETKEAQQDGNDNFLLTEDGEKEYDVKSEEELLPNISFKVYYNEVNQYIKGFKTVKSGYVFKRVENGKEVKRELKQRIQIELTPNIEEARVYTTGEDGDWEGKLLIQNLYAGKVKEDGTKEGATYTLVEVDGGENSYYIDPLKIESGTSQYTLKNGGDKQDTGIKPGHKTVNDKKYCTIDNVTIYYDDLGLKNGREGQKILTHILIENDRTSGDLMIEKNDETFPKNVKLEGAKFKIKLVRSAHSDEEGNEDPEHDLKEENKWLKLPSNCEKNSPNRVDSNNPNIGENNGSSTTVEEDNGIGNVSDENNAEITENVTTSKESGTGGTEKGSNTANEDGSTVYDYSEFLHDEYLTENEEEAGEFTTSDKGLIKILCIINGEYEIYETGASEGYDLTRQWYYGTDKSSDDDTAGHTKWVDYGKEENHFENWGEETGIYYPEWDDHGIVKISTKDNYLKPVYSNRKIVSGIKGNVWEDVTAGAKGSDEYDSLNYVGASNDKLLSESNKITVRLWIRDAYRDEKTNNIERSPIERKADISNETGYEGYHCIAATGVNSDGSWEILRKGQTPEAIPDLTILENDIYYWEIADGFIEYIYDNQNYICTDIFAKVKQNADNSLTKEGMRGDSLLRNSKVKEEKITDKELDDRNLTGVDGVKDWTTGEVGSTEEGKYYGSAITTKKSVVASEETALEIINKRWDSNTLVYKNGETKSYSEVSEDEEKAYYDELGLSGYYNVGNYKVENINLGLWEKLPPDYKVEQTLEYSKILMNGYTYTYDYNSGADTDYDNGEEDKTHKGSGILSDSDKNYVPSTLKEEGKNVYGAKVYPSDIAYTAEGQKNGMEMYVVYKITIQNLAATHMKDIYDEVRLNIDSLVNEYDSYKYSVDNESHKDDPNWKGSEYFNLWKDIPDEDASGLYNSYSSYTGVKMDDKQTTTERKFANYDINRDSEINLHSNPNKEDRLSDGLKENEPESVYIQFRVNETFLEEMLSGKMEQDSKDSLAVSVAHIVGHHTYTRTDNIWDECGDYYNDKVTKTDETEDGKRNNPTNARECDTNVTNAREEAEQGETKKRNTDINNYNQSANSKESKHLLHRHIDEYKNTGALGLMFVLGEEREISGIVFEDFVTDESKEADTNLGNGIIDDGETNRVEGVKVELIDASKEEANEKAGKVYPNEEYPQATLYPQNSETTIGYEEVDAYTETNDKGEYIFKGVYPGVYKLRFTYSDGHQVMKDVNGAIIDGNVNSYDYKSSIISTGDENNASNFIRDPEELTRKEILDDTKNYLKAVLDKNHLDKLDSDAIRNRELTEWYKEIYNNPSGIKYNIATDNFIGATGENEYNRSDFIENEYSTEYNTDKTRVQTKGSNEIKEQENTVKVMTSFSPYFSISIENDASDIRDVNYDPFTDEENSENRNGKNTDYGHRPVYENFNFGLIKTTVTKLTLDKIISNIKLTSSSGTILAQGDPKVTEKYITALDNLKDGSKYVRAEMGSEEIYGSQVEATYKLTISNGSVRDYIEAPTVKDQNNKSVDNKYFGFYFKYGDKDSPYFGDKEEEDSARRKIANRAYLMQTTVTEVVDELDPDYDLLNTAVRENVHHPKESRPDGEERYEETENKVKVTAKDGKLIFTEWSPIERDGDTQIRYKVNGLFREGMDLIYDNAAQITKVKLDYAQTLRTDYKWQEPNTTRFIITPDTGADGRITYYVIGILSLIAIATGIIIIKKGILKKDN